MLFKCIFGIEIAIGIGIEHFVLSLFSISIAIPMVFSSIESP
jgi:hypothetical protein